MTPKMTTVSRGLLPAASPLQPTTLLGIVTLMTIVAFLPPADCHRGHGGHQRQQQQPPSAPSGHGARQSGADFETPSGGFHDSKIVHDTDHINEHLQGKAAVNVSEMSLEELEFHYFKMHDFDNNTKLDGLEILKALTHLLPYENVEDDDKKKIDTRGKTADEILKEKREKELSYYTEIVDNVLADDDIDDDGYLTYPEYIIARRREEAREEMENKGGNAKGH